MNGNNTALTSVDIDTIKTQLATKSITDVARTMPFCRQTIHKINKEYKQEIELLSTLVSMRNQEQYLDYVTNTVDNVTAISRKLPDSITDNEMVYSRDNNKLMQRLLENVSILQSRTPLIAVSQTNNKNVQNNLNVVAPSVLKLLQASSFEIADEAQE